MVEADEVVAKYPTKYGLVEIQGSPQAVREVLTGLGMGKSEKQRGKKSVRVLILELIASGWFNEKKSLNEIQEELAKRGYSLPTGSITPTLLRDFIQPELMKRNGSTKRYLYYATPEIVESVTKMLQGIE